MNLAQKFVALFGVMFTAFVHAEPGDAILAKLDQIIIPSIEIEDASFEEALDFLRVRSIELDPEREPERNGVGFITRRSSPVEQGAGPTIVIPEDLPVISYRAKDLSLSKALTDICRKARMDAYVTSVGIIIVPVGILPFPNGKADEGEIWRHLTKPKELDSK